MEDSQVKRLKMVWLITIFMLLASAFTIFSFYLIFISGVPLGEKSQQYFSELGVFDWVVTALLMAANITGAILLFRLKAISFYFLASALGINILTHIWHTLTTSYLEAMNNAGVYAGAYMGIIIAGAIVIYSWRLKVKNVLS
jgi:hypothetical protein